MPQIAGFRGLLPTADKVAEVIDGSPDRFAAQVADGTRVREPSRALYRYHQVFALGGRTVTRKATIVALRLEPWSERQIRNHAVADPTRRQREHARIVATRAHLEPVFAGYRDNAGEVDRMFRSVDVGRPVYEHRTADGTIHRVFRSTSHEIMGPLRTLFAPKKVHVLDGHARYEAMLAYQRELEAAAPLSPYASGNYGLAALVNLDQPEVYQSTVARHRVIRGPVDGAAVIAAARPWFVIEPIAGAGKDAARQLAALADTVAHQPAFVFAFAGHGDAYKLTLRPDVAPVAEGVAVHRGVQKLDPIVFERFFAPRVFGDVNRIEVEADPVKAIGALARDDAGAAVLMRLVPLDQIIHADELGELLPSGSTGFAPALAAGIALPIDRDEDLV